MRPTANNDKRWLFANDIEGIFDALQYVKSTTRTQSLLVGSQIVRLQSYLSRTKAVMDALQ
jgi:hypothetical protein